MPHYRNEDGEVYWFDAYPGDEAIALTEITDQQALTLQRPNVDDRRIALWTAAKQHREALTDSPGAEAATPFGTVQVDAKSKQNVNGLVTMALIAQGAGVPFSAAFTMADNSVVTLNATQMIGMGIAIGQYVEAVYAHARTLRELIEAATTHDAIDAIDITSGWP